MSSLNELIQKLAGANADEAEESTSSNESNQLTDPVYVEKLASAVDFILDSYSGETPSDQTQETEKVASVSDISERLRVSLNEKLANVSSEAPADSALIGNVLAKLKELRDERLTQSTGPDADITEHEYFFPQDEVEVEESPTSEDSNEETSASEEADEEVTLKAASVENFNLADIMSAALSNTDEHNESVSSENVKTAGVRGSTGPMARVEATQRLREKLMAKVRGTEE
jgi:hypothetical protein